MRRVSPLLYAAIMCRKQGLKVAPSLLYIHRAASESYSPVIEMGAPRQPKVPVNNFAFYEDEFRERLSALLQEIYNPEEPFTQTEDVFSLLDNLLKWTKSQIGNLNVVYQDVDAVEVEDSVIDVFNMVAGLKKITIREEKPEKLPVCTDIDMLKTIIRNLLSNAIKFSNENSEVLVKMEEQGDTMVVSVKDSGCGIDEEGQQKLLHTDTHFSTFGTNNEEGSGLGLLLCQDFAVKSGGKLWFTSKKGEGSTFYFSIPLKK